MFGFLSQISPTTIAVLSAFFAAIAGILARVLLKDIQSKEILAINFFLMAAMLLVISPSFYHFDITVVSVSLLAIITLIDTLANYFYFKTFEETEASIAVPMLSLSPVFTFVFARLLLSDTVSYQSLLISLLILFLVIFFSTNFKDITKFKSKTLYPALASSFLFGISAIPAKYLLDTIGAINAPTLYMHRAALIALFSLLVFGFKIPSLNIGQYRLIAFRGVFVIIQRVLLLCNMSLKCLSFGYIMKYNTNICFLFKYFIFKRKTNLEKVDYRSVNSSSIFNHLI